MSILKLLQKYKMLVANLYALELRHKNTVFIILSVTLILLFIPSSCLLVNITAFQRTKQTISDDC